MMSRTIFFSIVIAVAMNNVCSGGIIVTGVDTVPMSTAQFTITINDPFFPGGFTEVISMQSGPFNIDRHQQQGDGNGGLDDFIDTEILDLTLTGNSVSLGPVVVRVGAPNGVQHAPTLGQITSVRSAPEGTLDLVGPEAFISGDSFFNIFFEVDAGGMTFYNRDPHLLALTNITRLPPFGTHVPPGPGVDLFLRVGALNDPSDPLVGSSTGNHITTPEPTTFSLTALGLLSLGTITRRRRVLRLGTTRSS